MTKDKLELWGRFRKFFKVYPEVGLRLDISRMRFDDAFFELIRPNLETAFRRMKGLEDAAIANPDENRMVGHYWLRTAELAPSEEIKQAVERNIASIKDFSSAIHRGDTLGEKGRPFRNVLLVGIGGSALGPQFVADALAGSLDRMKMFFCDNTDPDGIMRTLSLIDDELDQTLVIVISKSGGTIETRNGALELQQAYRQKGLSFSRHAVAVTCKGSKLDKQAEEEGWIKIFEMWDWVGGRTSIFSAVGLLPASLQGIDIDEFLAGARAMDALTRSPSVNENPAALLSAMWFYSGDGKGLKEMVVIPYKDRLYLFSKYLQQLVMESLGKELDLDGKKVNQGLTVFGNKGSTDQHAYIQQLREGLPNFFATFIEVLKDFPAKGGVSSFLEVDPGVTSGDYLTGFLRGTREALYENGRDSTTITLDEISEKTIGALIALYDRAVGLYAFMININAYHQPGVEAGKKAAGAVINLQQRIVSWLNSQTKQTGFSAQEIAQAIGAEDEAETAYSVLEHLASNPSRGIKRIGTAHPDEACYVFMR